MNPNQKIALITGAGKGIGRETAKQLASRDVHVIVSARSIEKAQESMKILGLNDSQCTPLRLEITDLNSIQNARDAIANKFGCLDILINNAGIAKNEGGWKVSTASIVPQGTIKEIFETNFFGQVAVTQTLLPLLMKSKAFRIVNVASILGSLTIQSDPTGPLKESKPFAYDASKTALNAFTVHLAYEFQNTPHKINSAHPGWVKTDMGTSAAPMSVEDGAKTIVELALLDAKGPNGGFFHKGERLPW